MGYRARRRRRRIRVTIALIAVLLCSVFLVSCMATANVIWVRGLLGFDVTDYEHEDAVTELPVEDAQCEKLCAMVEILSSSRGIHLDSFSNTSEAVSLYRDAILGYMHRENYSLYTGNRDQMEKAAGAYPQMQLSTLIPDADFENTVFRYFGGISVKNESGALYSYLNRANCYTAPIQGKKCDAEINVLSLVETEHTYRMCFTLADETGSSETYTAVFLKRDDGSCYFRSLSV